jgi:DNA-binding NarL/FixJ family response regulator
MNSRSVNHVSVHVIGGTRLQNDLLATFLEKETGLSCKSCDSLKQAPLAENGPGHTHLVLLDGQSRDADLLRDDGPMAADTDHNKCLFALCNVEPDVEIEKDSLALGLKGVFYNNTPLSLLARGVQAILDGELWYSRKTLSQSLQRVRPVKRRSEPLVDLTYREKQILEEIVSGETNQEIADHLNISVHTVKTHIYNMYKKLNVSNRLQVSHLASEYL